jgi:hypothetical protein
VDFKVSCSQIPRRAFAGIRTHDPLVDDPLDDWLFDGKKSLKIAKPTLESL